MRRLALVVLTALALAGCNTIEKTNEFQFVDGDGFVVTVTYGRAKKEHSTSFVSAKTGKAVKVKTHLHVKVLLPNGETFSGWEIMNTLGRGTMYMSEDDEWQICVAGMNARVFRKMGESENYLLLFDGELMKVEKQ